MVSGNWGCGKSYYISHTFMDQVTKILVPKGVGYYKPAFISLYGVSSVGDFEYRVFSGINQWTNNKLIRVLGTVGSKLVEAKGGSADKKGLEAITFIDTNRVLIFDDLERICEDKIPVKEVLGLINTYSEHSHFKVIIVCNEKHFLSDDAPETLKADYIKYKEKSVRFTYSFVSDINAIYDVMVSGLAENDYKDYLIKEKASILSIFKLGGENNLRTLKFFIDTFDKVFNIAKKAQHAPEVIRIYLVSYMLYMIENKQGLAPDDLYDFDSGNNSKYLKEKYEPVFKEFRQTPLLIDFIVAGYLDEHAFKEDVDEMNADVDKQVVTPEGRAYHQLDEMSGLEDEDVNIKIEEVLHYVSLDKYNLSDLLEIYALLIKLEHWKINGFEVTEDINNSFKASMNRQRNRHVYTSSLGHNISNFEPSVFTDEEKDDFFFIQDYASKINGEASERECISDFNRVVESVQKRDIEGLHLLMADSENRISVAGFDWMRVYELLMTAPNPMVNELCRLIKFLFPEKGSLSSYEINLVKNKVLPMVNQYLGSDDKRIRRICLYDLQKYLTEVVAENEKRVAASKRRYY